MTKASTLTKITKVLEKSQLFSKNPTLRFEKFCGFNRSLRTTNFQTKLETGVELDITNWQKNVRFQRFEWII